MQLPNWQKTPKKTRTSDDMTKRKPKVTKYQNIEHQELGVQPKFRKAIEHVMKLHELSEQDAIEMVTNPRWGGAMYCDEYNLRPGRLGLRGVPLLEKIELGIVELCNRFIQDGPEYARFTVRMENATHSWQQCLPVREQHRVLKALRKEKGLL